MVENSHIDDHTRMIRVLLLTHLSVYRLNTSYDGYPSATPKGS